MGDVHGQASESTTNANIGPTKVGGCHNKGKTEPLWKAAADLLKMSNRYMRLCCTFALTQMTSTQCQDTQH
jgi:hypothetical protein